MREIEMGGACSANVKDRRVQDFNAEPGKKEITWKT
jgi:hypothetical protein